MCGIFAYTGKERASSILIDGLRTLEYRGYDSAGIFLPNEGVFKEVGEVAALESVVPNDTKSVAGIAHTRWATHGLPTQENAHPHGDTQGAIWLVHNGIIENYKELRMHLASTGHLFKSETDTEVLVHLVEEEMKECHDFVKAVVGALTHVRGTYGIAVMHKDIPDTVVTARMGSPIALGIGENENFIASDASAIVRHTKDVIYLNDGEYAVITPTTYHIYTLDHQERDAVPDTIEWDVEDVKKQGHPHYMLKEIMEGPDVLRNTARGRIVHNEGTAKLGGIEEHADELRAIERFIIVGCGTAYYAGLVGKYLIEKYTGIPVDVEIASEFRYRRMIANKRTALIAVTQSGETADTLESLREAKRKGLLTLGIVNVVGSTIARESDAGIYNHAGPEIGVASTKAYISQIEVLALLALYLGRQRELSLEDGRILASELTLLPDKIQFVLDRHEAVQKIAEKYKEYKDFLYIGRKFNFATAYEGALKLKEISYIHAEGYGSGEMKHGPIAMIAPSFPTLAIAPQDSVYEKTVSNIEEIKARSGPVLAIITEGDTELAQLTDDYIEIPKTIEALSPLLAVVPLQLFAYYVGVAKGLNVDRPRNLAKSVTVE